MITFFHTINWPRLSRFSHVLESALMLMAFWQEVLWLFLQHRRLSNTYFRMRKEMFRHQLCLLQTHSTATRTKQIRSLLGLIFLWVTWLGKCSFIKHFNYSISLQHYYNSNFLSDFSKANNRGARSTGGFQTIPQQVLPCSRTRENQRYCRRVSFLEASHHENVQWQCDQTFCPRLGQIMTREGLTKQSIEAVPTTQIFYLSIRMIQIHDNEYYIRWCNQTIYI